MMSKLLISQELTGEYALRVSIFVLKSAFFAEAHFKSLDKPMGPATA
jgi:hypothetical protein